MKYYVVKFEPWHLDNIVEAEPGAKDLVRGTNYAQVLAQMPNSWTIVSSGGQVLWCGGTIPAWPGRNEAWSYVSEGAGPVMTRITRETRRMLDNAPGRTEITVDKTFTEGHRWARLLGFEVETPLLRAYGPGGEDHVGYVRFVE